jgi:hypothetical protein
MELEDNARFCPNCGTFFRVESVAQVEEENPEEVVKKSKKPVEEIVEENVEEIVENDFDEIFGIDTRRNFFGNKKKKRKPKRFTRKLRIICYILFAFTLWAVFTQYLDYREYLDGFEEKWIYFREFFVLLLTPCLIFGVILVLLNIHDFLEEIRDNMKKSNEKDEE